MQSETESADSEDRGQEAADGQSKGDSQPLAALLLKSVGSWKTEDRVQKRGTERRKGGRKAGFDRRKREKKGKKKRRQSGGSKERRKKDEEGRREGGRKEVGREERK